MSLLWLVLTVPAMKAYEWVAWNLWYVEFKPACHDHKSILWDDLDDLHFVEGDLSDEFWRELRAQWTVFIDESLMRIRDDGVMLVPRGFYFPLPDEISRVGSEPEERAYFATRSPAEAIRMRRVEEGVDMSPYLKYWEDWNTEYTGPRFPSAVVCGFTEELILKSGKLSR